MKVLHSIALMAVFAGALLVACSDDDDGGGTTPAAKGGSAGAAGSAAGAAGEAGAAGSAAGAAGEAGAAGSAAGAAGEAGAAGAAPDGGTCVKGADCVTCCMAASPEAAVEIMGIAAQFECVEDAGGVCGTQCQATLCTPDAGMPDNTCTDCLMTDMGFVAAVAADCKGAQCSAALACLSGCM